MVEQELRLAQAGFVYSEESGANRALTLAGLTLAPERSELADPTLARLLLSEAFVRAVGAITAAELASTSEALVALAACDALPARFKQGGLNHARELEANAPLDLARLRKIEAWLAELLRFASKERRSRALRYGFAAAAVVVAAAIALLLPRFYLEPKWADYNWRVSSALSGFANTGTLGGPLKDGLLLHTALQPEPWVVIDMNERRSIREIIIENRRDCCFERGLPLLVELSSDGQSYTLVGWKKDIFAEWTLSFEPRDARYVRLRSQAATYLQLTKIAIR